MYKPRSEIVNSIQEFPTQRSHPPRTTANFKHLFEVAVRHNGLQLFRHQHVEKFDKPLRDLFTTPWNIEHRETFGYHDVENTRHEITVLSYSSPISHKSCSLSLENFDATLNGQLAKNIQRYILPGESQNAKVGAPRDNSASASGLAGNIIGGRSTDRPNANAQIDVTASTRP